MEALESAVGEGALFEDRKAAGRLLAERLAEMELKDPLVLAIPKGGLPVALPVARRLGAQLGIVVTVKDRLSGAPGQVRGALAEGDCLAYDKSRFQIPINADFSSFKVALDQGMARQLMFYGPCHHLPRLNGRSVILVDDGAHSGWTVKAALSRVRRGVPAELILALPVMPRRLAEELGRLADRMVCLHFPRQSAGIATWYKHFKSVSDVDALRILQACDHWESAA